jgi:hypothetical protein
VINWNTASSLSLLDATSFFVILLRLEMMLSDIIIELTSWRSQIFLFFSVLIVQIQIMRMDTLENAAFVLFACL